MLFNCQILVTVFTILGQIGITLNMHWVEPEDYNNAAHLAAQERKIQFLVGWFAKPILVDGMYPDIMRQKVIL